MEWVKNLARYFDTMGNYGQAQNDEEARKAQVLTSLVDSGLNASPEYGSIKITDSNYNPGGGPSIDDVNKAGWIPEQAKRDLAKKFIHYNRDNFEGTTPMNIRGQQFHIQSDLGEDQNDAISSAIRDYFDVPPDRSNVLDKVASMQQGGNIGDILSGASVGDMPMMDISSDQGNVMTADGTGQPEDVLTEADKERIKQQLLANGIK